MIEIPLAGAAYNLLKDIYRWATDKKKFSPEERIALAERWKPKFEEFLIESYMGKLRGDCIIRDVKRIDEYPGTKEREKRISAWFRVGLLDAQHDGILVAFHWQKLIEVSEESYRVAKGEETSSDTAIKVVLAAKIPYHLIQSVNFGGDEFYQFPHFYCHFLYKGEPYKAVEFYDERQTEGFSKPYFVQIGEMKKIGKLSRKAGIKHL